MPEPKCLRKNTTKPAPDQKAGFACQTAHTGAVTLVQRFGSALNLNLHFHMLFLDAVYVERSDGCVRFRWVDGHLTIRGYLGELRKRAFMLPIFCRNLCCKGVSSLCHC